MGTGVFKCILTVISDYILVISRVFVLTTINR